MVKDDKQLVTKKDLKTSLEKFDNKLGKKFDVIDRRFNDIDGRFNEISKRFSAMDNRFEIMEKDFSIKLTIMEMRLERRLNEHLENQFKMWGDKIFNLVDGLGIEIRDGREHREITSHQITENRTRIEILEKKVFETVNVAI
jgi:hypothetical protein